MSLISVENSTREKQKLFVHFVHADEYLERIIEIYLWLKKFEPSSNMQL